MMASTPHDLEHSSGYRRLLLAVVMLAVTTFGSLMTIVTVSLGIIAKDLGSDRATLTWMITGLMLTMAVVTPLAGRAGDIYGHRKLFLIGLFGGALTTAASALAWDATSVIVFRVLFGLTGAMVMPNGMALMIQAYGPERRATAMGWFQFATTGAPTIGLVLGGPMIDVVGWRGVFYGFAGVSALAFVVGVSFLRPSPRLTKTPLDLAGATTLGGGVLTGLLALTRFTESVRDSGIGAAATDPVTMLLAVAAVVGLGAFVVVENRVPSPMLKLQYFKRRRFTLPMVSSSLVQFAYMGGFVVTPALLDGVYGLTVGTIAVMMAPRPGAFSLSSPLGGYLATAIGDRVPMILGGVAMVVAMAAFAGASLLTGVLGLAVVVVGLLLSGVSAGISQPAVISAVVGAVDPEDVGIAGGMSQQVMFIGVVSGIQTLNVFVGDKAEPAAFATAFVVGGLVAFIGLLAAVGLPRTTASPATQL